jgi:quercetin dioxygenase-like cupin family protein
MKSSLILALALAAIAVPASSIAAPQMTARTILNTTTTSTGQRLVLPGGTVRAVGSIIVIPVGYTSGYHKHLYPRYAYVLSGHLDVQDEGGKTRHYAPGDLFIETVNSWHRPHVVGNAPVRLLVIDQMPQHATTNTVQQ